MTSKGQIVDVWMQHPTKDFLAHPMFGLAPNGRTLQMWA
jgi:hypothetical protein